MLGAHRVGCNSCSSQNHSSTLHGPAEPVWKRNGPKSLQEAGRHLLLSLMQADFLSLVRVAHRLRYMQQIMPQNSA